MDVSTIKVISIYFLSDKNFVYQVNHVKDSYKLIKTKFDPKTFIDVRGGSNYENYFKDSNGAYYNLLHGRGIDLIQLKNVDIPSFESLPVYLFAKDKSQVFYKGQPLPNVDPDSFEILSEGHFKDKNSVYGLSYGEFVQLSGIDSCSYELIDDPEEYGWEGYSIDKNFVYYNDKAIPDSDPRSFRLLKNKAFDKNFEYRGLNKIPLQN